MQNQVKTEQKMGLEVKNLNVFYGARHILHNLTLKMMTPGRITALLGPNGSGKSTFLRAVAGLTPFKGDIFLGEDCISSFNPHERTRIGAYVPQTLPPTVHLQVLEAVMIARRAGAHIVAEEALQESMEVLGRLNIAHLALCYLNELSGGQRQLVGLAQALVRKPKLLLLDEPLSALDLRHQVAVMEAIRQETEARNIVTLIVVHDLNIALQRAHDVVYLRDGCSFGQGAVLDVTTPETLAAVYGVNSRLEICPRGLPHVLVDGIV